MSKHPVNLAIHFFLELAAWTATGIWGWHVGAGIWQYILAFGLPILTMAIWGIFRVPNDPGPAPVVIPGWLRLIYELALFGFAVFCLYRSGFHLWATIMLVVLVIHHILSYDRIWWLLTEKTNNEL